MNLFNGEIVFFAATLVEAATLDDVVVVDDDEVVSRFTASAEMNGLFIQLFSI